MTPPRTPSPTSSEPNRRFDDRAVARGMEVFQSSMPPSAVLSDDDSLHVLMHAGTLKAAAQIEQQLGEGAQVRWDSQVTRGSIESLLSMATDVASLRTRVVALIDARWVDDTELERFHAANPLLPVVIVAREEGIATLGAMAACVARGCVAPGSSVDQLSQALDVVSRGELSMPPSLVPYLYACMLAHRASMGETKDEEPESSVVSSASLSNLGVISESTLTPREVAAIELARTGYTNKQIAKSLGISGNTVKKHLASAFDKLGIHRRRQLF